MSDIQQPLTATEQQSRVRRRSAQQTLAANRRNICATSFDFLDGSFKAAARLRLVSIVVAGVVEGDDPARAEGERVPTERHRVEPGAHPVADTGHDLLG